jgi:hypothetical protein
MQGMMFLTRVKSFIYRRNEIGEKSALLLIRLFGVFLPENLEELRFERAVMSPEAIRIILDELAQKNNYLRRFALVENNLDNKAAYALIEFIENSRYLMELDLSNNHIVPKTLRLLLKGLNSRQNSLQMINLSFNFFREETKDTQIHMASQYQKLQPDEPGHPLFKGSRNGSIASCASPGLSPGLSKKRGLSPEPQVKGNKKEVPLGI